MDGDGGVNGEVILTALSMRFRYKIISIDDENYIVDVDRPFWIIFFPLIYWLIPHTVYKINDQNTLTQIKEPSIKQTKVSYINIFAIVMTMILARLLENIEGYFDIQTSIVVRNLILLIFALLILSLRLYISKINQRNLYNIINPELLTKKRLWIKPQSITQFLVFILFFAFILLNAILFIYFYFEYENILMLICSKMLIFFLLFANTVTMIPGTIRVKFQIKNND